MSKRVSLITGGLQGIGRAIACELAARKDRVIIFDYRDEKEICVQELLGEGLEYIQVDVASQLSVEAGFAKLDSILSDDYLSVVVNNAGIARDGLALRMSEEDWDRVCDVNLKGSFLVSQQALKRLLARKAGYIITISSIVGLHGNAGQANYAATKAGLIGLTKSLAREYGSKNICINAIAPGFIDTQLTQALPDALKQAALQKIALKRFGTGKDVAHCVEFLSSGRADYITGHVLSIDGGML